MFGALGVLLGWLTAVFVASMVESTRWPIEANKDAAAAIDELPPTKVVVNIARPITLRFTPRSRDVARADPANTLRCS